MSFTLVASCREALSGVVSTRLIREQEAEDAKAKAYEEVSLTFDRKEKGVQQGVTSSRLKGWMTMPQAQDGDVVCYQIG